METGGGGGDDVRGLKFGKKIYFEQDAAGGSGSAAAAAGGKKGKGAGALAPRCKVEGCGVDLSGLKTYHCRHKVCELHSKTPRVVVAGLEQRFCQQCSRFHQLPEFDQAKRSCRKRLADHNERRRRPQTAGPLSRNGRIAASFHEEQARSFWMDFSYPMVTTRARDAWPSVQPGDRMAGTSAMPWQGSQELHPHRGAVAAYGDHAYGRHGGSPAMFPAYDLAAGGGFAGVTADSSCALSLLSSQPWDSGATHSASHNRQPGMSTASTFGGNPVAPSVMASSYMAAAAAASSGWISSRGHDGVWSVPPQPQHHHHLPHAAALHEVHLGSLHHGHFSGELELELQGGGGAPNPPPHAEHRSGGAFSHSSNAMNWSL